jgi:hypothetical protein
MPAGPQARLTFTDADLTLLKTKVGDRLVDRRGMPVIDPDRQRPIVTGIGANLSYGDDISAISKRHPEMNWKSFDFDESDWDDPARLMSERLVPATISLLKADQTAGGKEIVVTARVGTRIIDALAKKLKQGGLDVDGVFAVWNDDQVDKLKLPERLDTPARKALTMAATIKAYDPDDATVRQVRFVDDSDENLQAAMQLLPRLFPDKSFEFVDVVHTGGEDYVPKVVARSGDAPGTLVGADGRAFGPREISAYRSDDAHVDR